jgi:hypothetical protein
MEGSLGGNERTAGAMLNTVAVNEIHLDRMEGVDRDLRLPAACKKKDRLRAKTSKRNYALKWV